MPTFPSLIAMILEAFRLITAQPGPPAALFIPARDLIVASAGPEQAALPDPWPTIDQAAAIYAQTLEDVRARYNPPGAPGIVAFTTPEILLYTPQADGSDRLERDAALLCLSMLEERGFFELLARTPAMGVGLCLEPAGPSRSSGGMVECDRVGTLRQLARAIAARSVPAREAGDWDRVIAGVEQQMALVRIGAHQLSRQPRVLRNRTLVSMLRDVSSWTLTGRVPAERAGAMLAAIDRQSRLPTPAAAIGVQELELNALIARTHTLDPGTPGQGRLLVSQARAAVLDPSAPMVLGDPLGGNDRAALDILGPLEWPDLGPVLNVAGVHYATRARAGGVAGEYVRRCAAVAALPYREQAAALNDLEQWAHALPSSDWLVRLYALGGVPGVRALLRDEADLRMRLDGVRLMLAIEAYRAKNNRLPAALGDLVPGLIKGLPVDPYSGSSFVYTVTDAAAFAPGTGYVLYSVWDDATDNKGVRTGARNQWGLAPNRRANCDFIVNDLADARENAAAP